ncbi:DNA-directed RNA polymerase subunit A' [Candidatus Woesearchaeota archaeon]|jgi:DNA-directed RNA polymerase subunit A'|nr:DNA-directed RNA polymerase subunit A' [Candidatus Woesearchaeota archaeon]MBT4110733.1 DNA-directed RNA polymerase subunit A' [Candidatus Woesearchaeota archaeon]MBT4336329.1 DNA-directed RNA polymerase subunit A' [Candidatus Woesearchaeota archaeon]MBT4469310.1 DNA-directed RNA polymerase subunit A' [Candidatus Woesearchaeota archaeon]MBT6743867.1 DNA-directed RNA polymerase subunit A' [Candidatus Woesearchaeota archaeon]
MDRQVHKKVCNINFSLFSPKQIMDLAAAKVVTPELYDREGYSVDGGLMDIRLGVIDPGLRCKTCGQKLKECPGHFGYIELARPVIHIKFVRQVLDLLKSTCKYCGQVLIPENNISKFTDVFDKVGKEEGFEARRRKIKEVVNKFKTKEKCPHCEKKQEKIKIEKPYTYYESDLRLSPIEVRARLEKVPSEDLKIFGYVEGFRPEWMVLTVLQIPPVTMRPSITLESGERSEDDLTHKLGDIVRINQRLFENINAGAPEVIIEDLWDLLQYHVTTFFDNAVSQLPPARHRGGQVLKTLAARIKSKEGRLRHNLAGKRTDFSARTVISPDPFIDLNQVGVPLSMSMNLTVPERVTEWNKEYLLKFVKNGPKKYPGANYIIKPDGKRKSITEDTQEEILEELEEGYLVERHLLDGDVALFNRQPSLHRMSMMCHKVKVLPGKTFRLNPAVCNPYNADFDGDEMNLHIPQNDEARAEAKILMLVDTQIISPRYGLSVVGCIQDAITGNYLLTKELVLSRAEATDLLYNCGVTDLSPLPKKEKVDGSEVFSVLLPNDFSFIGKDKSGNDVKIVNGKLKSGYMDKSNLGQESGLMLRNIYEKYGPAYTAELLGKISKLGISVLARRGFSIGIGDMDLPLETQDEIRATVKKSEDEALKIIDEFYAGKLDALPGRSVAETLELNVLGALNKARNKSGDIAMKQVQNSAAITMARSGARGNPLNIAQMTAVVGQQALRGKRIESGFKNRTMSYFGNKDLSPKARGFVKNNFKSGLTPAEFFFGAMTGRDALMDTALRTPKSGYLYRRLSNALQDLKVEYDGTVRDASSRIVQFSYGEDGLDVSKTKNGVVDVKSVIQNVIGASK